MKNLSTTDYFQFSFRSWTNKTTERRTTPWRICFSFVRFRFEWSRSSCRKIQISEFVGRFSSPFKINKFNRFHRTTWNDRDEFGRHDDPFVHFDRSLRRFSRRKSNNFRWTKNSWRSSTKRFSLNFRDAARRRRKTMETFETHNRRLDFFADFPNFLWEKKNFFNKKFFSFFKDSKKSEKETTIDETNRTEEENRHPIEFILRKQRDRFAASTTILGEFSRKFIEHRPLKIGRPIRFEKGKVRSNWISF